MDCSIKLGKSPECSGHSVGRRSIDDDEQVTIQYKIETPIEIEQFGNIVTSKIQQPEELTNSASKLYSNILLLLTLNHQMTKF